MTVPCPSPMNPFTYVNSFTCDADTLSALVISLLNDPRPSSGGGLWPARTVRLIQIMAPVLVWVRDHKGIPLHMQQIYCASELRSMSMLVTRKLFRVRDRGTRAVSEAPVPDMPEALLRPVQSYLGELPGFDPRLPYEAQGTTRADQQHSYATFYLAQVCFYGGTTAIEA